MTGAGTGCGTAACPMEVRTDDAEAAAVSISDGLGPRTTGDERRPRELTSGSDEEAAGCAAATEDLILGMAVGVVPPASSDILGQALVFDERVWVTLEPGISGQEACCCGHV